MVGYNPKTLLSHELMFTAKHLRLQWDTHKLRNTSICMLVCVYEKEGERETREIYNMKRKTCNLKEVLMKLCDIVI